MKTCPSDLRAILRGGVPAKVIAYFDKMPESRRAELAEAVLEWNRLLALNWAWDATFSTKAEQQLAGKERISNWSDLCPAASLATIACLDLTQIRRLERTFGAAPQDVASILRDRWPNWRDEFAEFLCEGELTFFGSGQWKTVRHLVREGIVNPPKHEHYVLGAICSIWPPFNFDPKPNLQQLLLAERDWLDTDFWRLFELEGTGEVSLANWDKYRKRTPWAAALIELSQKGEISRDRLLDASLAALSRDFIQFRAGWFSRFHELLAPTPQERVARIDAYLALLNSSIPPTVSFAASAIAIADRECPIPGSKLLPELRPVLHARGKAVVKGALQLLERVAKRESDAIPEVCHLATLGLLNEAPDVQEKVFDLLDRYADRNDPQLRDAINEAACSVAASLRPRLQGWIGSATLPTADFRTTMEKTPEHAEVVSAIDPSREIEPVSNFDDLIHLAAAILEQSDDPEENERLLEGLCRLGHDRPEDFDRRTAPLRKRALKKYNQQRGLYPLYSMVERSMAMLLLTWIDRKPYFEETPSALARNQNEFSFLFRRLAAIGRDILEDRGLPLLSAPTHSGGWIDPRVLVKRWLAWKEAEASPNSYEQVLAMLRLARERREEALDSAISIEGESGEALRFALGADVKMGPDFVLWLAAWRCRQPFGDLPEYEKVYPGRGPDAGVAASYHWNATSVRKESHGMSWTSLEIAIGRAPKCSDRLRDALLPVLFQSPRNTTEEGLLGALRWSSILWPANQEALFAHAAARIYPAVDYADVTDREFAAYLEPICRPHTELRAMGCLLLALGVAVQGNALRGLAQDGMISAIADGRLDAEQLGGTMSKVLDTGHNKFVRWAKSLREVARVSRRHAEVTSTVLQRALQGDPEKSPRDIAALLELLRELLTETGSRLAPATQRYISSLEGGGKTKRLVKQLLAGVYE